jgi:DNA replication protein DnaC
MHPINKRGFKIRPLDKCPDCGKEFERSPDPKLAMYNVQHPQCTCREDKHRLEAQEEMKKNRKRDLRLSGLPRRMLEYSFSSFPGNKTFADKVNEYSKLDFPGLLILAGNTGTGKSGLAAACACAMYDRGCKNLHYEYAYDLLVLGANWEKRIETLKRAMSWDFLIIDEIGIQLKSEPALEFLERVLIGRYEDMKPTILVTNLKPTDFWNLVGGRVRDRIKNCGQQISFSEGNLRDGH